MNAHTPLYYAVIGTVTGLAFQIGTTTCFAPTDEATVLVVPDTRYLTVTAPVPDVLARFLRETVVEPRLLALSGRAVA